MTGGSAVFTRFGEALSLTLPVVSDEISYNVTIAVDPTLDTVLLGGPRFILGQS